jgi:hypothetical protein
MDETQFQNIDTPIITPLSSPPKKKFTIPLIIIVLVILISLIILSLLKKNNVEEYIEPSIPTPTPVPTIINQANQIPTQFKSQFDQIDSVKKDTSEILPPTVDK